MRLGRILWSTPIVAAIALAWSQAVRADERPIPKVDYSADMVMSAGGMQMTGKLYTSGEKERQEMEMAGQRQILILRPDQGVSLVIVPQQQMYMRMPLAQQDRGPDPTDGEWSRTKVGTETVNGVPATKYQVTTRSEQGDGTGFVWLTDDNIMVRMEMEMQSQGRTQRVRRDLKNLKTGKVDPALFEPPAGYQEMRMPVMPQGMPGAAQR